MANERSDVVRISSVFQRFHPHGRRSQVVIGVLSFIGGLTEASVLVLITTVAVATTKSHHQVHLGPLHLSTREVLGIALGLVLFNVLLAAAAATAVANASAECGLNARQALLAAFHDASYQRKSRDRTAALQEALTTYVDRLTLALSALSLLIAGMLNLVGFAFTALVINPFASIALAFIGALMIVVLRPAARLTRTASSQLAGQRRIYAEGATESVLLAREEAVFGVTAVAGARLQVLDADVADQFRRTRFLSTFTPRIYQGLAFAFVVAGLFVLSGTSNSDLSQIGAVVLLLVRSLSYGQQLLGSFQTLSEFRPYVDRLTDLLESYQSEPRHKGDVPIGPINDITLRDVTFAYEGGSRAVSGLNMTISAGETLGVLGPSGAGKSTLVNLLLRLYEPSSGDLLVNGVQLRSVDDTEWHDRTAIVPQEPRLIHGTIADNIRFLRNLPDDAVHQAAEEANIARYISTLPLGYESPVGELGAGLSGGQRQRICIARALAGKPDLLILDEPTSALDGESEAAIQRTLENLQGKVTMVVVAHRLSTLTICDRLAVLKDGQLAAIGTPAELEASSGYYRDALRLAGL